MMLARAQQGRPCYLLDTSILVAYIRAGDVGEYVETQFGLRASPHRPLMSVVSIGEVLSLARKLPWGEKKKGLTHRLLQELVSVDINDQEILQAYAELDHFCLKTCKPAQRIGQNDLWIAATASVTHATLLTMDKHFSKFHPKYLTRVYIDQDAVRPR